MSIRRVIKRNRNSDRQYVEYRLVKSYRKGEETGQIVILTMQDIRVPENQWKALVEDIEA